MMSESARPGSAARSGGRGASGQESKRDARVNKELEQSVQVQLQEEVLPVGVRVLASEAGARLAPVGTRGRTSTTTRSGAGLTFALRMSSERTCCGVVGAGAAISSVVVLSKACRFKSREAENADSPATSSFASFAGNRGSSASSLAPIAPPLRCFQYMLTHGIAVHPHDVGAVSSRHHLLTYGHFKGVLLCFAVRSQLGRTLYESASCWHCSETRTSHPQMIGRAQLAHSGRCRTIGSGEAAGKLARVSVRRFGQGTAWASRGTSNAFSGTDPRFSAPG